MRSGQEQTVRLRQQICLPVWLEDYNTSFVEESWSTTIQCNTSNTWIWKRSGMLIWRALPRRHPLPHLTAKRLQSFTGIYLRWVNLLSGAILRVALNLKLINSIQSPMAINLYLLQRACKAPIDKDQSDPPPWSWAVGVAEIGSVFVRSW